MKSLKIAITSDFHGYLPVVADMPKADVLLIAGDVCPLDCHDDDHQAGWLTSVFAPWLDEAHTRYDRIIGIAGNHDFIAQAPGGYELMRSLHWVYLDDEEIQLNGVRYYGSPYSNKFGRWAFMEPEDELAQRWAAIPRHTDILLIHGPAYRLRDRVNNNWGDAARDKNVGSKSLRDTLDIVKPLVFACGHIHEGYGREEYGHTVVVNGSYNDERYRSTKNPIQVVEL